MRVAVVRLAITPLTGSKSFKKELKSIAVDCSAAASKMPSSDAPWREFTRRRFGPMEN